MSSAEWAVAAATVGVYGTAFLNAVTPPTWDVPPIDPRELTPAMLVSWREYVAARWAEHEAQYGERIY